MGNVAKLTREIHRVRSQGLGLPPQLGHVSSPRGAGDVNSGLLGLWQPREGKAFVLSVICSLLT